MNRLAVRVSLALFFFFAAALAASAQNASVSGVVTDASGGAVANVQVTLTNEKTGAVQQTKTDGTGLYSLPYVQPGQYTLAAELAGFKRYEQTTITLETAQNRTIDVKLQVGNTQQSVTVNGSGIQMNTTDGSVSTVVDQTFVSNIPLNGRSLQDLIALTPGAITTNPSSTSGVGSTGDFSINGQRSTSNGYIVDGVSANFSAGSATDGGSGAGIVPAATALGTTQSLVSLDDLQEFRVLSSSYSAEYGQAAGGQIVFTTRSGTNDLHGSLYDYLRNGAFDANNWFNNALGQPKTSEQQNDFGGTFGGPVRIPWLYNGKDKTFFFFSYEGLRLIQPQSASLQSVPDLNLRANSAAAIQPILNAFPLPTGPEEFVPCSGTTFSDATPDPCPSGDATGTQVPSGAAEFARSYSVPSSLNATSGRLDHNFSSKMSAFFRFSNTPSNVESRDLSIVDGFFSNTRTYTVGITNQLSSNIANSFRLGYASNSMFDNGYVDNFGGATPINFSAAAGIGAGFPTPEPDFLLDIAGTVGTSFFITDDSNQSTQWNLVDTVSVTKGHHQLKFGFDYRRLSSLVTGYDPLVFGFFSNAWEIQNNLASYYEILTNQPGKPLLKQWALFAQDEWRVAPRLSLSLGLRWDVDGPPTPAVNGQGAYTMTGDLNNPSTLALAPRGTPLWHTSYLNFAPRLGAAYEVRTHPGWETVVRSGGGVFFDTDNWLGVNAYQGLGFSGSFTCPTLTCGFSATPSEIALALPSTAAPYTGSSVYDFPARIQLPYVLQWNLSIQQSLGAQQSLTVSYVGAAGRRMPDLLQFGDVTKNPNFNSVISAYTGLYSNYNALQTTFQRRLSHGVQALASYTWSHSLANVDEGNPLEQVTLFSTPQYGNSDEDLRENFAAGASWDLPSVNHDSITKAALSHWGLDLHFVARTGFPVPMRGANSTAIDPTTGLQYIPGVSFNASVPLYLYGADCTAYYIAHGNPLNGGSCPGGRAINPAAFGTTGTVASTAPINIARGFGANQINLAIRREFPLRENLKLQFRGEIFNILNHPNFGGIDGGVPDSTFGLATATLNNNLQSMSAQYQEGGPRSMQFALRLVF